jgi:NAD+ kinase
MSRVGFILKPDKSEAGAILEDLVPWLHGQGHVVVVTSEDQIAPDGVVIVPEDDLAANIDLAVVLGGDGTMLRASALVGATATPVLGINLGRLGFLTPFDPGEARRALTEAIAGELPISERMRLAVTFQRRSMETGEAVTRTALNDAVVHQGAMARLIELKTWVDHDFVSAYRADGIIIATPTGSTAYNLAAGGPILVPSQRSIALTPICAHSLTNRPLVVGAASTVRMQLGGDSRGVVLTVDGQWAHSFLPGDVVEITAAPQPLRLFDSGKPYFDIMREKLHWGARSDRDR